jgi:hypothetical protein
MTAEPLGPVLMKVLVICGDRHPNRWEERELGQLGLTIAGNGAYQIRPWCRECDRWATGSVPVLTLNAKGFIASDVQVVADYRGTLGRCSHRGCEREAVEDHHFAPRAIFADADDWPRALLCVEHHQEWHRRIGVAA